MSVINAKISKKAILICNGLLQSSSSTHIYTNTEMHAHTNIHVFE